MKKCILLVRHAESANNALPEEERVCDPALTPRGEQQSQLLATGLAQGRWAVSELYCSPFKRSLDTTLPISRSLNLRPIIRADIYEQGGCYSGYVDGMLRGEPGMCCNVLSQLYPKWTIDPLIGPRGWNVDREYETHAEVVQRAANVKLWLTEQWEPAAPGTMAALVIHADFKRVLMEQLLGKPDWHGAEEPIWNTAVSHLSYDGSQWKMATWNSVDHLPRELRTPVIC